MSQWIDCNLIDWPTTWDCLHFSNNAKGHTSFEQNTSFTLAVRLLLDELPLMAKLQTHKPFLYDKDWNCALCGLDKQTWSHLWSCPTLKLKLAALRDVTLATTIKLLSESDQTPESDLSNHLKASLSSLLCWSLPQPSSQHLDFSFLLRGFIPSELSNLIRSIVGTSSLTHKIIGESISAAQQVFKDDIWQHHLTVMHEFERIKGITQKDKYSSSSGSILLSRSSSHISSTSNRWLSWITKYMNTGLLWQGFLTRINSLA